MARGKILHMKKHLLAIGLVAVGTTAITTALGFNFTKKSIADAGASTIRTITFNKNSKNTWTKGGTDSGLVVYTTSTDGSNFALKMTTNESTFTAARQNGYLAQKSSTDTNFHLILLVSVSNLTVTNYTISSLVSVSVDYTITQNDTGSGFYRIIFNPDSFNGYTTYYRTIDDPAPNHEYRPEDGSYSNSSSYYKVFDVNFYGKYAVNFRSITVKYNCAY